MHKASAPGEFPKTDRGDLVRNITIQSAGKEFGKNLQPVTSKQVATGAMEYTVGSRKDAPHGFYLELKSPLKGGRPWLLPSVNHVIKGFKELLPK